MGEKSFESELQKTFLMEAEEMLEDAESAFIAIESNPNDTSKIDKIFRFIHTIKGSAYIAGFNGLGDFAHQFESLLHAIREKKMVVTSAVIDILLEGNDFLKCSISILKSNPDAILEDKEIVQHIKDIQRAKGFTPAATPKPIKLASVELERAQEVPKRVPAPVLTFKQELKKNFEVEVPLDQTSKILICDDDVEMINTICDILRESGFKVLTSSCPPIAFEIFKTQNIEAIFLDFNVQDMDGVQFLKKIRSINEFVPIALVANAASKEKCKDYLKLGVDCLIDKPYVKADVIKVTKRLVMESQLRNTIVKMSNLSFQVYVTIEKLMTVLKIDENSQSERELLARFVEEMRQATVHLLSTERELKKLKND